ncbi:MAG: hypothetical protein JWP27_993 [Flaviaesturariibacter sp.]|nr:hypothetical protein [Flaviaesturariibacter sp.]
MKRILTSALAILLLAGAAQAQEKKEDAKAGKHKGHEAMKGLNLTADQKAKMKALHEQQKAELEALRNQSLTAAQRKEKMQQLHEAQKAKMDAILTNEQRAQLAKSQADRQAHARTGQWNRDGVARDTIGRRHADAAREAGNRRAGQDGARLAKELNLTADQQAKVKAIQQDFKGRLEAVRNDESLSKEQKQAKAAELFKAQQEQMKAVLTAEQQEKMKTLRASRGTKRNAK